MDIQSPSSSGISATGQQHLFSQQINVNQSSIFFTHTKSTPATHQSKKVNNKKSNSVSQQFYYCWFLEITG
jgi:hypothetical protein